MAPGHGAVDHVCRLVAANQLRQRFQQRIEHIQLDPAAIAPEYSVPPALAGRKMTPLRACPRHPHHAVKKPTIVASWIVATSRLSRQQRADQRPLRIRRPNRLVQCRLQMAALN